MARKRSAADAPLLPSQPAPRPAAAHKSFREYQPATERGLWRIEHYDLLTAELGAEPDPAELHDWARNWPRPWMILRRLFGINPLALPLSSDPEEFRVWSRAECATRLGVDEKGLRAELLAIKAGWAQKAQPPASSPPPASTSAAPPVSEVLIHTEEELLGLADVSPAIFNLPSRPPEENARERQWFVGRLNAWVKLLESPLTQRLAGQALLNELRLRREEALLWAVDLQPLPAPESKEYSAAISGRSQDKAKLQRRVSELEETLQSQLRDLDERAPWFNVTGKTERVTGCLGELVQAIADWEARGENRRLDGLFTALELQVLHRTHRLMTEPQYRPGKVAYIAESLRWLWDPLARSTFDQTTLAKMDAGYKGMVANLAETGAVPAIDIEEEEYPSLYRPPEPEVRG